MSAKTWSPSGALGVVGNQKLQSKVCVVKVPSLGELKGIALAAGFGGLEKKKREPWGKKKEGLVVRAAAVAEKVAKVEQITLAPIKSISGKIKLPGSKSLSNRTLLLAALSEVLNFLLIERWFQVFFTHLHIRNAELMKLL